MRIGGNLRQVSTSQEHGVHPWELEYISGAKFRLHLGKIYDMSATVEATQSNFGKYSKSRISNQNKLSGKTSTVKAGPNLSNGSSPIYFKGNLGRPSTVTAGNTNGIVEFKNSDIGSQAIVYLILNFKSPEEQGDPEADNAWYVALVNEGDILTDDFKIAAIVRSGSAKNVIQLWKSDFYWNDIVSEKHAFKVTVTGWPDNGHARMQRGTVNDVTYEDDDVISEDTSVWIKTYPTTGTVEFNALGTTKTNSNTEAWVKVASIIGGKVNQYVSGSLVMERFKIGADNAKYWHSSI